MLGLWDRITGSTLPATLAGVAQMRASLEAHAPPMDSQVRDYLEEQLEALERERDRLLEERESVTADAALLRTSLESVGLGGAALVVGIGAGILAVIGAVGAYVYRTYHLQQALAMYRAQWERALRGEVPWSSVPPAPWEQPRTRWDRTTLWLVAGAALLILAPGIQAALRRVSR